MTIDTSSPVVFHDDRAKSGLAYALSEVLWEDPVHCLCRATLSGGRGAEHLIGEPAESPVLFNKKTGEVQGEEFLFWHAYNVGRESGVA